MIASIKGNLDYIGPDWIIVAIGGISVKLSVPSSTIENLGPIGNKIELHTFLQIRDNDINLYGFSNAEGRSIFEILLSISGVGPRLALSLLSFFNPESLAMTIASSDIDSLSMVPGLGKKTASRIVLELKGKLQDWSFSAEAPHIDETTAALIALGYSANEVIKAVSSLPRDSSLTTEESIRLALQKLSSG